MLMLTFLNKSQCGHPHSRVNFSNLNPVYGNSQEEAEDGLSCVYMGQMSLVILSQILQELKSLAFSKVLSELHSTFTHAL